MHLSLITITTCGPVSHLPVSLWDCEYIEITREERMRGEGQGANMDKMCAHPVL